MIRTDVAVPAEIAQLQTQLLAWFAAEGRDLPWRRTRDPYQILVSEVMLQQTQVERVKPKYSAFLKRFPTAADLADAPTSEVIRMWQGLGYNRRAVNLQRAAQAVVREHAGRFPATPAELRALPGIGDYTAGAVACFAFERDVVFLDTNIRRVLRRLFVGPDAQAEASDATLLQYAQAALPQGQGWAWNQAVMELGALICTASKPACQRCPVRAHCRAYAIGSAADADVFAVDQPLPAPRQRRVREQQPFTSTSRYFRGRIVDALRALPDGGAIALEALGPLVRENFSPADLPWLAKLAQGLVTDGLAVWTAQAGEDLEHWQLALPA